MSGKRYTDEFKAEAVRQVTERGHREQEVASRLGVTTYSLYRWMQKFGKPVGSTKPSLSRAPRFGG